MATVPMDVGKVARCRALAAAIADDVQRYIEGHTTTGVERTVLRAYGADGVDGDGVPLVNAAVDRYHAAGLLGHGIAFFLGRAILSGSAGPQDAAERLAYGTDLDSGEAGPTAAEAHEALAPHTVAAFDRIDRAKDEREALRRRAPPGETPTNT